MNEQPTTRDEQTADDAGATVAAAGADPASATAPVAATTGRVFVYNGQEYPDPDPDLAVDHVRRELARFVPELTNADVREERRADGATRYIFTRRLGTKGATPVAMNPPGAAATSRAIDGGGEREEAAPANARLLALIGALPATRLEIYRLAHELALPNGEFDLDAAAARGEELERAGAEAHEHARATGALRDTVLNLPAR